MLSLLITLLVALLIISVVWYVIRTMVPLQPPIDRIVQLIFIVLIGAPTRFPRPRYARRPPTAGRFGG